MNARFHLKPMDYIQTPESKLTFNRSLFAEVAPKYDFITKALSFGRDTAWKRALVAGLPAAERPACIDLACGTGDITRLLAERYPDGEITGFDLTPSMLDRAAQLTRSRNIRFLEGSMQHLPFESGSLDLVTGGYALRNAPDLNQTIDEIARVLRPGGTAAFLDFSKPRNAAGQRITHFALKFWGGLWGTLLHGNPDVYGYIADSLKLYPDRTELRERFEKRGFVPQKRTLLFGGMLEISRFKKG
ncbi:ubiquinone/menaquinone biosynthesis methyltransferase [Pontiella agarivorans]|uniref:Ubiquinone/menaquinone biosynthesis methyltransferase n=1 Tax=Pontiella agarivorans TaxID=3038953 RepID=A0ABU5MZT1_9BACT|nr:ubiquinone/menaquinone biosynthesis methyltransferase [Pontiella agarivorans]MDZ8119715.1 ubiquinone/menaquinone biosynthesis methyltransferase [Pontiella agarivorans]